MLFKALKKLKSYTIQQRVQIIELFYQNGRLVKIANKKLRNIYLFC